MPPLYANTRSQTSFPPFVDNKVDIITLMQTLPDFDQFLLQFINTLDRCLVYYTRAAALHPKSCNPWSPSQNSVL